MGVVEIKKFTCKSFTRGFIKLKTLLYKNIVVTLLLVEYLVERVKYESRAVWLSY